jgi:hypothetical protein
MWRAAPKIYWAIHSTPTSSPDMWRVDPKIYRTIYSTPTCFSCTPGSISLYARASTEDLFDYTQDFMSNSLYASLQTEHFMSSVQDLSGNTLYASLPAEHFMSSPQDLSSHSMYASLPAEHLADTSQDFFGHLQYARYLFFSVLDYDQHGGLNSQAAQAWECVHLLFIGVFGVIGCYNFFSCSDFLNHHFPWFNSREGGTPSVPSRGSSPPGSPASPHPLKKKTPPGIQRSRGR